MELRSQVLHGEILHPGRGFEAVPTSVEVRWDPLTGYGARLVIAPPGALFPPGRPAGARQPGRAAPVKLPVLP